jgi:hypothetical protein
MIGGFNFRWRYALSKHFTIMGYHPLDLVLTLNWFGVERIPEQELLEGVASLKMSNTGTLEDVLM